MPSGGRDQAVAAGNGLAADLVTDALDEWGKGKSHGLHAFGIALHAYADTFAHQGFSAFRSEVNAVRDLSLGSGDERRRKKIMGAFFAQYPGIPPRIGHAEAFSCPDLPFLTWYYTPPEAPEWIGESADWVSLVEGRIRRENPLIASTAAARATDLVLQCAPRKANRKMIKGLLAVSTVLLCVGCGHQLEVKKLEDAMKQSACTAKAAMDKSITDLTLEYSVTNGYEGSATIPIPVVPLSAKATLSQTENVTVKVNVATLDCSNVPGIRITSGPAPAIYLLDTKTGQLHKK